MSKIVELLLKKGSDINQKDGNGNTPLMTSIKLKYNKISKFLLNDKNININITNNIGESALHIACNYEQEQIVELIVDNKDIDINIQDNEHKYTALMYAVSLNNIKITQLLLNNPNINILIQDIIGNTAFHHGINQDVSEELIKLLDEKIESKKESDHIYNLTNLNGNTILHLLLEKNIQINLKKYIEFQVLRLPLTERLYGN